MDNTPFVFKPQNRKNNDPQRKKSSSLNVLPDAHHPNLYFPESQKTQISFPYNRLDSSRGLCPRQCSVLFLS